MVVNCCYSCSSKISENIKLEFFVFNTYLDSSNVIKHSECSISAAQALFYVNSECWKWYGDE
jgi:hypothetical protein